MIALAFVSLMVVMLFATAGGAAKSEMTGLAVVLTGLGFVGVAAFLQILTALGVFA